MWPPSLFADKGWAERLILAVAGPITFGIVAAVLLGASEGLYLVWSVIALIGMVLAGYEHPRPHEGALRGVVSGSLFGVSLLIAKAAIGSDPKADLPDPEGLLVVFTVVISVAGGAAGAALRRRMLSKPGSPAPTR